MNPTALPDANPYFGKPCIHCKELIVDGDQGLMMPAPMHTECLLRHLYGSVGHQRKKCFCFGGDEEDPPGLSKREAAKAAVKEWEARRYHG